VGNGGYYVAGKKFQKKGKEGLTKGRKEPIKKV
jgi:hypothetical protein